MSQRTLWLRWSWRDLRRQWVLVTAIALVIALGTGTYAALLGTSEWRYASNDTSFGMLDMHDVRIRLNEGSTTREGQLTALVQGIPSADQVTGMRERLVVPTQVAGPDGMLVPGELVGSAITGKPVDGVWISAGRGLRPTDDGRPRVVLERQFAEGNALPPAGRLVLSGGVPVRYVGQGQSPEYFLISVGQGALPFLGVDTYAVLFTTLHSAQAVTGARGQVNDLVLTLAADADRAQVVREIETALGGAPAPISATVTTRDDVDSYRVLYDDIEGDERLWRVIAMLVLLGAAFAALNLTSRVVEAQRHEIGIGMALGVRPRLLAVRPLLFGAQVALIGVLLGLAVGWLLNIPLRDVFEDMLPLPVWTTDLQVDVFLQAAALGFVLPFAAVAWPVWRALRVEPVDAIRVGHLAATGRGRPALRRRLPIPGPSYRQVPLRDLARTPRRTTLTALGIAAAITTTVTLLGIFDAFGATIDRSGDEVLHAAPDRVTASLRTLEPVDGPAVQQVSALPAVGTIDAGLLLPTTTSHGSVSIDLVTEVLPPESAWTPTLRDGQLTGGLVLAEKAAEDLGVGVGDTVQFEHATAAPGGIRTVESELPVAGVHTNPMRVLAYTDEETAASLGLGGLTNLLTIRPAPGFSDRQVERALLSVPDIGTAQSARATVDAMQSTLDEYLGVLRVAVSVTLLLALLIAFNSTSIGVDERSREHATMLAFGLPVRTVVGLTVVETLVLGVIGTVVGVAAGYGVMTWVVEVTVAETLPDIDIIPALSGSTVLLAVGLGTVVCGVAPVLTSRRIRRMDIPSTLRVIE